MRGNSSTWLKHENTWPSDSLKTGCIGVVSQEYAFRGPTQFVSYSGCNAGPASALDSELSNLVVIIFREVGVRDVLMQDREI